MARILLVEDDLSVHSVMEHIMLEGGYEVAIAESTASGIALITSEPFDLAICDVKLPDGSGLLVAAHAIMKRCPVLVITGYGLSIRPATLAPYDYLLKPIRSDELLASIQRTLAENDGDARDARELT
jgi:DNA-binding NtrC family response regulator